MTTDSPPRWWAKAGGNQIAIRIAYPLSLSLLKGPPPTFLSPPHSAELMEELAFDLLLLRDPDWLHGSVSLTLA